MELVCQNETPTYAIPNCPLAIALWAKCPEAFESLLIGPIWHLMGLHEATADRFMSKIDESTENNRERSVSASDIESALKEAETIEPHDWT